MYYQFRSKLGLLEAVVADAEARARVPGQSAGEKPPRDAGEFIARSCAFWSANESVVRNVMAFAMIDDDVAQSIAARDQQRRDQLASMVRAFDKDGRLLTSKTEANDVLHLLSSFMAYDQLRAGPRPRTPDEIVAILTRLATAVVTAPAEL